MAEQQRDLISRLADRGEEMLSRFSETPGAHRVLELLNSSRERLDDLQKRVIGLENLERRLDDVEKRLQKLEKTATPPKRATPARKPAARKPAATKPPVAESPAPPDAAA